MTLVLFLLRHSRSALISAAALASVSGVSSAGLLVLINVSLSGDSAWSQAQLAWAFAALVLFVTVATILSHIMMVRLGQSAIYDLRLRLSEQILSTPLRRLEELGAHRILVALTDDISALTVALSIIPALIINGAFVIGGFLYLAWLSPPLFLFLFTLLVVGGVGYVLPLWSSNRGFRAAREERDVLFGFFRSLIDGAKELKLHSRRQESFLSGLERTAAALRDRWIRAMTGLIVSARWGQLMVFVILGVLVFAPAALHSADRETLTAYCLVLLYLMTPIHVILGAAPEFLQAGVVVRKLEQLGFSLPTEEGAKAAGPQATESRLEVSGVTFSYREDEAERGFDVGPLDLRLRSGEVLFLTGGNGSGKTTVAKLLTGLYLPAAGRISLDGVPIAPENVERLRQSWSAVFSDFHLFESLYGLEGPELESRAAPWLEQLQLSAKVEVKDGAFTTTDLSQGQRKRLALLTAYLEDRPFYLFDEWAADQDPEFREIFYRRLLPRLKERGKGVVVISHDDAYFDAADRLIKLDYGRVRSETVPERVAAHR